MDECPSFAAQKNKLKNMSPSNPERQKLLESIKKRICDKTTQLVCCERKDSRCVAIEEEIVPQVWSSSSSSSLSASSSPLSASSSLLLSTRRTKLFSRLLENLAIQLMVLVSRTWKGLESNVMNIIIITWPKPAYSQEGLAGGIVGPRYILGRSQCLASRHHSAQLLRR